jgi:fructose-1,6-bisphosphatase/inositol monophosphatase family enzyme
VTTFDGALTAGIVSDVAEEVARIRRSGRVEIVRRTHEGPTTNADMLAERALVERLTDAFGPARFLAEESNDRHDVLVDAAAPLVWIIDPLDGTSQYLSGSDVYGVQVAAYGYGVALGAWISCPDLGWEASAWEGGELTVVAPGAGPLGGRAVVADGDFDENHRSFVAEREPGSLPSRSCACEYVMLAASLLDSALYRRTYPWDHAPGAYLVHRSGGVSLRWDGTRYDAAVAGRGIVSAARGIDVEGVKARQLPRQ